MKKIICLIAVLFIFMLASCSKSETTKINTTTKTKDEYTGSITISLPGGDNNANVFYNAIERYNKIRPHVNINVEWQSTSDFYSYYKDKLVSKDKCPDAVFIDHIYVQQLADKNLILDITNDINDSKSLYINNMLETGKLNDKYYAYPFSANTICLFYNKDILGDRNVPTTYTEFLEVAKSIAQAEALKTTGDRATVFALFTGYDSKDFGVFLFNSWLKRENGTILSDDLKTCLLDSESTRKALTKLNNIATLGYGDGDVSGESLFYSGKVAFIEMGCWKIPELLGKNSSGNFGVAPLFKLEDEGNNSSVLGLYSLVVTKQTDETKMKIASDFCKFLSLDTETQLAYSKHTNLLPVTKEATNDEYYNKEEWQVFINSLPTAALRPASPVWPTIQTQLSYMIINSVQNKNNIDTYVTTASSKIQNALNQYYSKSK